MEDVGLLNAWTGSKTYRRVHHRAKQNGVVIDMAITFTYDY